MAKRTALQTKYDGVIVNIFTIAEGLTSFKQHNLNVETVAQLLIDDAIDMGTDLDAAADYALAAAQLIDAYKLEVHAPVTAHLENAGPRFLRFVNIGPDKINVIKAVRQFTDLSLKEAKDLVEGQARMGGESVSDDFLAQLRAAGATVDIG